MVTVPAVVFQRPRDPEVKSVFRRYLLRPVSAGQDSGNEVLVWFRGESYEIVHTLRRVAAGGSLCSSSCSQGESSPLVVRLKTHIEVCRAVE